MNKFKNSKITSKLSASFILVIALFLTLGLIQINYLNQAKDFTVKMYNHPFTVSNTVKDIQSESILIRLSLVTIANSDDIDVITREEAKIDELDKSIISYFDIIYDRFLGDKSKVDSTKKDIEDWRSFRSEIIKNAKAGDKDAALAIVTGKGGAHYKKISDDLAFLNDFAQDKAVSFFKSASMM